jgi:hypothetical protein
VFNLLLSVRRPPLEHRSRLPGDLQVLAGRDHKHAPLRAGSRDFTIVRETARNQVMVDRNAEEIQAGDGTGAREDLAHVRAPGEAE